MQVDEFLFISEENSVYDIPDNDQLIREIAEMFKKDIDAGNVEEMDDSTEITTISASSALTSSENVRLFLLQQEDTGEQIRLLNNLERFVSEKKSIQMKQTAINQYFNGLNNELIYLSILLFSLCYTNNHFSLILNAHPL